MNDVTLLIPHWLHLLGAMTWIGGILTMTVVVMPALAPVPPALRIQIIPRLMRRFLCVVWLSLVVLLATGGDRVLRVQQMWESAMWLQSSYGHTLLSKLLLILGLLLLLGRLTFALYPRIREHARIHAAQAMERDDVVCAQCSHLLGKARRTMRVALLLGLLILLLAAKLRIGMAT